MLNFSCKKIQYLWEFIKVAIADDHKIFRKGVILSLRAYSNIKFVQEAENGQELLDGLAVSQPDVILMDLRMPLKDGIETTKSIAKLYPADSYHCTDHV